MEQKARGRKPMDQSTTPIAVVGYGCRFPGDATSPDAFFRMLAEGRSAWSEVPKNRYNVDAYWHPSPDRIGTTVARGAHWLEQDPAVFDAPFFKMTGSEASALDPQLRTLLEVVYECLENGGMPMENLVGSDTSVFVGSSSSEYGSLLMGDIENLPLYTAVGTGVSMLANRISHFYDLRGTSVALDTACSSGLVAVHLGCQTLRSGESRMSLIAASQFSLCPDGSVALSRLGFLSPDSRCYTFDERANGYARGEGICAIALKRLDDALADGDNIRAVIRGTLSNQDGNTPGIVQPNPKAQVDLMRATYAAAGLDPQRTKCFEAHGTGTTLGDPLEVSALVDALETEDRDEIDPLYIGSVKTNIGHLEGCAGLAGLLKAILSVQHGVIFPSLNYEKPNHRLLLDKWRLRVPTKLISWPGHGVRRVSVNSFGYGGTNAHVIVEGVHDIANHRIAQKSGAAVVTSLDISPITGEGNSRASLVASETGLYWGLRQQPRLYVFSSPEQAALTRIRRLYADHIHFSSERPENSDTPLTDLAYTLGQRRSVFQWRTTVVAESLSALETELRQPATIVRGGKISRLLFVFTGQGAQSHAMGRELLRYEAFASSIKTADRFLAHVLKAEWSVVKELAKNEEESNINSAKYSQPLCTVVQVALVDLLRDWGIQPTAVIGHSSGEICAAYAANVLSAEDAWTISYHRGRLSHELPSRHQKPMGMMAVGLSEDEVQPYLHVTEGSPPIMLACINSSQSVTLSGDLAKLQNLNERFASNGTFARLLKIDIAYHSPYMQAIAHQYADAIEHIRPRCDHGDVIMLSSVTVRFLQAVKAAFPSDASGWQHRRKGDIPFNGLIEIGPHGALQGPLRHILAQQGCWEDVFYTSVLKRGHNACITALEAAGTLWANGYPVELQNVNCEADATSRKVIGDLPSYPWNHSHRFWYETGSTFRRLRTSPRHDLIGVRTNTATSATWRNVLRSKENPWVADFRIGDTMHLPPPSLICMITEAGRQLVDHDPRYQSLTLRNVEFERPLSVPIDGIDIYTELRGLRPDQNHTPTQYYFTILTMMEDEPCYHCTGQLMLESVDPDSTTELYPQPCKPSTKGIVQSAVNGADVSPRDFYTRWATAKLHWGPRYQLLQSIKTDKYTSSITLELKDTKSAMPAQYEYEHLIHPTTMDSCFQGLYAIFESDNLRRKIRSIESLTISLGFPHKPGSTLTASSQVVSQGFGVHIGNQEVLDESKKTVAAAKGVRFETPKADIDKAAKQKQPHEIKKVTSNLYWKPDIDKLDQVGANRIFRRDLLEVPDEQPHYSSENAIDSLPNMQKVLVPDKIEWRAYAAKILELCGHKTPTQVVLQITSGVDIFISKAVGVLGGREGATPVCSRYIYANSSDHNLPGKSDMWKPWGHYLEHKRINMYDEMSIGRPDPASVDLIIVTDVISDVAMASQLLANCKAVLKHTGWLVLCQVDGSHHDGHAQTIRDLLAEYHFDSAAIEILTASAGGSVSYMLAVRKRKVAHLNVQKAVVIIPRSPSTEVKDYASAVKTCMCAQELDVTFAQLDELPLLDGCAVVSLLEADAPLISDLDAETFVQIKDLFTSTSKGGLWVKRGNTYLDGEADPKYHASTGLLRVLRNEMQESRFSELALSHRLPLSRKAAVEILITCFRDIFQAESLDIVAETEVAELDDVLYIPRLYDEPIKNRDLDMLGKQLPAEKALLLQLDRPLRLEIGRPDDIRTLRFVDKAMSTSPLGDDEIDVDVKAHKVVSIKRIIDDLAVGEDSLGCDAAGVVAAVGRNVESVRVGDRVALAAPGLYKTSIRVNQACAAKLPDCVTLVDAATLPKAFLMAYHILYNVCRVDERDSILICNADEVFGSIMIQLALHRKANVFAITNDSKPSCYMQGRCKLESDQVYSASSEGTIDTILRLTDRVGVDIVVSDNSDDIRRYMACCSELGKVIKIGRPSHTDRPDDLGSRTYSNVQLKSLFANKQRHAMQLMQDARDLLTLGIVQPIVPANVFTYSDMQAAFELADLERKPENIVLELGLKDVVPVVPVNQHPLRCDPQSTFVVLGGLGGLGRWLLNKLAEHGARHIACFSRSGAAKPEAQRCIKTLAERGVTAKAYVCDIGDADAFAATVARLNEEMPPVRGAVHATMALSDDYFDVMTAEGWSQCTRNKIQGALNMHRMLPKDMDFFVLVSSLSPIMGTPMQANYASGNAFLDGLAFHRRSMGLKGCAVNFGLISEVGYVAEHLSFDSAHGADFALTTISPPEVWSIMESAMTGYLSMETPMPPQLVTCAGSGGLFQQLKHIKTHAHIVDPKYKYINCLDARGGEDSFSKLRQGRDELFKQLENVKSFDAAVEIVETALVEKIASAIPMPPEDVDPSRAVSSYGVDSLIANEIRNWAFQVVKGSLSAVEILSSPSIASLSGKLAHRSKLVAEDIKEHKAIKP